MSRSSLPRRHFLVGAGRTVISLPLLEAMFRSDAARAQGAASPRFAFLFFPNGTVGTEMSPTAMNAWKPVLAPFEPVRNEVLFIEGLHNRLNSSWKWYSSALGDGSGHEVGAPTFFTCRRLADKSVLRLGVSIDQLIGQALQKKRGTRLSSLVIADGRNGSGTGQGGINLLYRALMSWKSDQPNDYAAPLTRPAQVFSEIFAGWTPTTGGSPTVDPAIARLQARKKSILDTVKEQEDGMRARLGAADVSRLDQFFTSLREVEKKVSAAPAPAPSGARCEKPATAPMDVTSSQFAPFTRTMMDLAVLALQCGVTPSVCYQMSRGDGGARTGTFAGVSEDQHGVSHHAGSATAMDKLRKINAWYSGQYAYLIERLAATQELGVPLLRNVVTVYGSEISDGNSHNGRDLPVVLAGGQSLGIKTGGILDLGLGKVTGSVSETDLMRAPPLANLFLTLAKLAGVEASSFGNSTGTFTLAPNKA
jgi:hypothetical protein